MLPSSSPLESPVALPVHFKTVGKKKKQTQCLMPKEVKSCIFPLKHLLFSVLTYFSRQK